MRGQKGRFFSLSHDVGGTSVLTRARLGRGYAAFLHLRCRNSREGA